MPITTQILAIDRDDPDLDLIAEAARIILDGGLVAFATETVYGLGADATNPAAVARIFEAKGRPAFNPLIVHADGIEMIRSCVSSWPERAQVLADPFWPGPLTLVLPRSSIIPDLVTAGLETVGVRVPAPAVARSLIAEAGRPIAAPSANRSTGLSPTRAEHVQKDLTGKVDLILDSGPTDVGLESTILDLSRTAPRLLRPGWITPEELEAVLGQTISTGSEAESGGSKPSSPGQMTLHYAPRTPCVIVTSWFEEWTIPSPFRIAVLLIGWPGHVEEPSSGLIVHLKTPAEAARRLYDTLHQWDDQGLDEIQIVPPPDSPEWRTVRDRIARAVGGGRLD